MKYLILSFLLLGCSTDQKFSKGFVRGQKDYEEFKRGKVDFYYYGRLIGFRKSLELDTSSTKTLEMIEKINPIYPYEK